MSCVLIGTVVPDVLCDMDIDYLFTEIPQ